MADNLVKQLILKIFADTGDAKKKADQLGDSFGGLGDSAKKAKKGVDDNTTSLKKHEDQSKKSEKAGFGVTDMLKGLGIAGLASKAIDTMTTAFMSNQKVADTVNAVIGTINEIVSQLIDIFMSAYDSVSKSTGGFDALGKVLTGVIRMAINPFKIAWYEISLAIDYARLAWEKSPFGDDDPKTIKELNDRISETKDNLVNTVKDSIDATKQVVTNFAEAVGEVGQFVETVADGVSKIDIKATFANQQNIVALQNTAKIAAAELQGVIEKYGAQAEGLRQIRDDDRRSISERIAANNQLGEVLKKQQEAQLALANKQVESARAELAANKTSVELKAKVVEAENGVLAIKNQIIGAQSEQLANDKALAQEAINLGKSEAQNDNELYLNKRKANAELMTDELKRAEEFKRIRAEERALELQRLKDNINQYAEGTQARIDAEKEFNTKKQEMDAEDAKSEIEIAKIKKDRELEVKNAKIENALSEFEIRRQLLDMQRMDAISRAEESIKIAKDEAAEKIRQLELQRDKEIADAELAGKSTDEIKEKYKNKTIQINNTIAKSEKDLAKAKMKANTDAADSAASSLNAISELFGKQSKAGKALAIASTIISTFSSAQKAYESTVGIPIVGPVLAPINAALAVAAGYKSVQEIKRVQVPGGGSEPSVQSMNTSAPLGAQPASTILPQEQINQIASANAATRAYVVESDVTSNQERIVRLNRAARIN